MYKFRDTTDASETRVLPSEALKINGEYIEDLIPGYRTLYVTGREALSPELDYIETGNRDGATAPKKRYPPRTIIVGYQLSATSNTAFRDAFNVLAGILDVEDAELIFNDEPDKYFTGTPSGVSEVEPGRNSVVGELEFFCADPFKYSVTEYEVTPTLDNGKTFLIDYKGTAKSFPKLEAAFYSESETDGSTTNALTGNGDCGHVSFFNEREKIILLGDEFEADGQELEMSQTLINQKFNTANSWGTAAKNLWPISKGVVTAGIVQGHGLQMAKSYANAGANEYYLTPNYGTYNPDGWKTATVSRTLPADDAGEVGATNFELSYKQKMAIGGGKNDTKQYGLFQVILSDANDKIIAGASISKNTTGKNAKIYYFINGKKRKETYTIDLSLNNKNFGQDKGFHDYDRTIKTSTIRKTGKTVEFKLGGTRYVFKDEAIKDAVVTKVTFSMGSLKQYTPLTHNGLYWVHFVKHNCETWHDVPNKFTTDNVVTADCNTGEIFLNDAPAPDYGAMGNDWDEFYLVPGVNQIGTDYSYWVEDAYKPTFKLKYREVFL